MEKNLFQIAKMSSSEIAEFIKENPSLIIPIGGLTPIGDLPLEAVSIVVETIANKLSIDKKTLIAPTVNFPYITPFKSFEGVVGVRGNIFSTTVADLVRSAISWGVKKIIFIDGGVTSETLIHNGIKKYKRVLPKDFEYEVVTWQNLPEVRKATSSIFTNLREVWRSDAALVKLYSEITESPIKEIENSPLPQKEPFGRWKKMGFDPKKLRNLTSTPIFSNWSGVDNSAKLLTTVVSAINIKLEI